MTNYYVHLFDCVLLFCLQLEKLSQWQGQLNKGKHMQNNDINEAAEHDYRLHEGEL